MIAVLVPTYKRAYKLEGLIQNFNRTSSESKLYFIVDPSDRESLECLDLLSRIYSINILVTQGEYVAAINYGVKQTKEPFILCAADDIEFVKGWDLRLLKDMEDPKINIIGGIDDWLISKTGVHISHPLVRRSYIKGDLYFPGYKHYMCDIELVQRGWKEKCIKVIPEVLIHHRHPEVGTAPEDETYEHSRVNLVPDWETYQSRCAEFEMWDVLGLFEGVAIPTELSPDFNPPLISIVLPVYNAKAYVESTLNSIFEKTYYPFELIIIDDNSEKETAEFIESLQVDPDYKKCVRVRKIHNIEQKWVNFNWNVGTYLAKGDYIAVLNSDIVLSKNWDKSLVIGLYSSTVTCPWEHTAARPELYKLDPVIEKYAPNMIKGACFMFKKEDRGFLFPIPFELKHWCGDNWIADQAEKLKGVKFVKSADIYHYISRSGAVVDKTLYNKTIRKDIDNYEKLSGKNMDWLRSRVF